MNKFAASQGTARPGASQELAEAWTPDEVDSNDELADGFEYRSRSHDYILAGYKDNRSRAESNQTVTNTPRSTSVERFVDISGIAATHMAASKSYFATPMSRQPSETSSVSTLHAGGSDDELIPAEDFKTQPALQQKDLVGVLRALDLPTDRRRPAQPSFAGAECRLHLKSPLKQLLTSIGHNNGSDLAAVVLVAWSIVLSRLSGEDNFVVGMGYVDEKGLSTQPQPVRVDLSEEPNAIQLLDRVKHAIAATGVRPLVKDVDATPPKQEKSSASFQVAFYPHNGGLAQPPVDNVSVQGDLELHMLQDKEDAALSIHYATDLYNKDTVERHVGYLNAVLTSMVSHGSRSIASFDIISSAEKRLLLEKWNDTVADYPADRCIHRLFEDQVNNSPDAIALIEGEKTFNYLELNTIADGFACQLVDAGVNRGDFVAILLERSIELVAAQLAVLKVGAAYVPIDPKAPVDRQAYIVKDSAAVVLVTDTKSEIPSELESPLLRFDLAALITAGTNENLGDVAGSSLDTAYVMYTSGSTGLPKGVMVSHRGIARLVINNGFADIGPSDSVAFATNPSFDPSTFNVWAALLNGARITIIDNDTYLDAHRLAEALEYHQITVLLMNMALFHQYAFIIGHAFSNLRYLVCGGEQGMIEAFSEVLRHGGPVRLFNAYGPTEATVNTTTYQVTSASSQLERLPIGRPVSNTQVYVLDKHYNLVPIGAVGELYIGGPGVAHGYLNRSDLTAERFLPDPFSTSEGARMYKTGDLVRYLSDGNLVFMGRNDDQVKIRGFRIELGEIEVRLAEHPDVREVAVLATDDSVGNKRLVAYVVSPPLKDLVHTLRNYLDATLPEYMIPSAFVRLDAFPLTNNGKISRRALPAPQEQDFVRQVYEEPVGEMEQTIAAIWSELLGINLISRRDSFFALGGHSLLVVRMMDRLHRLGLTVPIKTVFESPTLSVLAETIHKHQALTVPPNLITEETNRLTPEMLPLIDLTQADIDCIIDQTPGGLSNIQDIYSLAPLQDGIMFHHFLEEEGDPYLLVFNLAFQDRSLLDDYLSAFQKVVNRHDILRTSFIWEGLSTPAQVVLRQALLSVSELSLDPADGPILEQLKQRYNYTHYRIDLTRAPLLSFAAAKDENGQWILVQMLHHMIGDHATAEIMNAEVEKILQGQESTLSTPSPFRNQIAQVRAGPSQHEHEVFFKEMLSEVEEPTYPFGLAKVHNNGDKIKEAHKVVPQDLNDRLRAQAKRLGVTLAALCHTAWAQVLARTSGQDSVVFGTVLVGGMQGNQDVQPSLGITINTLPFRCDMDERSVQECVYQIHSRLASLVEHENASLALAQRCSGVPAGSPLFSALLNYRHTSMPTSDADQIEFTSKEERVNHDGIEFLGGQERTNYPFTLSVEDFGRALGLTALVIEPVDAKNICGYMEQALHSLVVALESSSDIPVSQLEVLTATERTMLLESWNATDSPYPDQLLVHQIFEQHVQKSPNAIAVEHGDHSLTYVQLNTRANHLAHQLIERGVKAGDRVATYFQRSFELIIAQLAIYKVGATYVPIDSKAPVDRQAFILRDSNSCVLLASAQSDISPAFDGSVFRLENELLSDKVVPDISVSGSGADIAYIMYTSGSTGVPKGVVVPHRGIVRLVINNGYANIGIDDHVAFTANPAFDASTFEVWAPLLNGGRVIIIDTDTFTTPNLLAGTLDRYQVTAMFMTTALFNQYVHSIGASLAKLRYLLCGGEQENLDSFSTLLAHGGPEHLVHCYGPTETTTYATTYEVKEIGENIDRLPIGRPISNTRSYVLDKHGKPVPLGAVGELYLGGPGVANGYLNRPDLTAERFLPDPFNSHEGARMYKTGDLVRYLPDGNIVFVGRNDGQVKIRGFRIEPGEIQARLEEHDIVKEATVVVLGEGGDKRLVAYVVADVQEQLARTLREYLVEHLPEYMIPSAFVRLDAFPLTNNGKIDRRALPEPDSASFVTQDYVAPQGETEVVLAELWSDLLKIEQVGRHDNFFMLGGHSLLAVQMIGRLHRLEYSLSVRTLFDNPVLSVLAATLSKHQDTSLAPSNLIETDTTRITPEMLPLIDLSQDDIDQIITGVPGGVANIQDIYGLSPLQDGVLFHHMMATKGDPYLLLGCTAFESRDLLDRYLMALQKVVDRHDILRTAIMWDNLTSPAQVVLRQATLSVKELSLDPANGPIIEQVAKIFDSRHCRMELSQAPLLRNSIVQDVDGRWILAQQMHHIIGDHSTVDILEEEIMAFMEGRDESLPAPQPYRNLVAQARLGVSVEEHEKFFNKMLQDIDTPSLPYGQSDIHNDGCDVTESHRMLPQELNNKLRDHAKRLGVSVASLCHLAYAQVIAATSGQAQIVFGTVLFGRMQGGSGSDRTMGLFINTLPLRVDVGGTSILETVRRVQTDLAALLEHEHASLALAQRCSNVPSGMPLFSALLNYRHSSVAFKQTRINPGMEVLLDDERTNYPFVLSVEDFGSSLGLTAQVVHPYNPSTICGYMQQALQSLVDAVERTSETPVQALQILPAEEYDLIIHSWNNTDALYPSDRCVHQLFEDQVERTPEAVAVVHDDRSMTYRTLNNRAIRLAHKLVHLGVEPRDNIAILLPRSFELIIVQLAILKVGAAYVPIDAKAPLDRQAYIASDSNAKLLITDMSTNVPVEIQAPLLRLGAEQENNEDLHDMLGASLHPSTSSQDTAYIMYTSGSTGLPKGVTAPHRGIVRLVINNGYANIGIDDHVAFTANPAFDASTFEVWAPLLNGGRVIIIDADTFTTPNLLAETLDRYQVTAMFMTTALFNQYVHSIGASLAKLRYLLCGGEQENLDSFSTLLAHGGPEHLVHCYGPTETTTYATTYEVKEIGKNIDRLPIGRPISNTRSYVLDKHGKPVPLGAVGELYLGGPGVANGYLNRPDLTAERFLPDPFNSHEGARMYKTGDLVRYLPDGNIVFVGRNDGQVKIRGFRIELGEIQARLEEHDIVKEATVVVLGEGGDKRLVAYVVADVQEQLARTLREYLVEHLPEYMIPSAFVRLDAFPLTNNGKINRRALPEPDSASFITQDYVAPQGETEVVLAELWSDLLKIEQVGRHDNFFMLGGHSLLAVQMIGRLHRLEYSLSVRTLFDNPVLSVLAATLSKHQDTSLAPSNLIETDTTRITPEMLPLIDLSQDDIDQIITGVPGGVANIQDIYGLSPLQDGVLFHHMMATKGDPYLLLGCTAFESRDLLDRYLMALQKVVDRHDILRTAIMWDNLTSPAQVVLRQATLSVKELSLDPANGPIIEQVAKIFDSRQCRMDLSQAPLFHNSIVQDVDGRWILAQQMHHIIGDHSTVDILEEEIVAFMEGRDESLPVPQPYRNLVAQARLGVSVEEHEKFFNKMLQDIDTPSLPYGQSDIHNDGCDVTESHRMLPQELNNKLRDHAKRLGVSVASLCHLAYAQVIAATSGQAQIVFGTVLFGRMQGGSGSDRTMGLFINTLPLRVDVGGTSILETVRRVQTDLAALLEHEHASLALAQRCSNVPSGMPLFSALLNYRHSAVEFKQTRINPGIEVLLDHERTNYPFVLSVEDFGSSLGLTAQVVQPYNPSTICGYMQQALQSLVDAVERTSETPVQALQILPAEEYDLIIHSWNNTDALYPSDRCVHQLFEDQVERTPEAVAVVHDDRSMTYRTLNNRAIRLAHKLVHLGVEPRDNIAILLPRSFELIIVQLAILKVGAAYVPIDAKAPVDRQAYMASDSSAKLLITDMSTNVPVEIQAPLLRLGADQENSEDLHDVHDVSLHPSISSQETAYIMYTSGSTGLPKGVMVSHRAIARLVINNGYAEIGPDDHVAFVANPTFDPSVTDIWVPLLHGARVIVIDSDTLLDAHRLAASLDFHKATYLHLATALFHQYAYIIGPALSKLKYLLIGGEQVLIEACLELLRHGGPVRLINSYGPTETTVNATTYEVTDAVRQLDRVPIGRPINNTSLYVLDRYGNPVASGVIGELYIGGPGVANGYLNRPDLTAERFLPDPFSNMPDARMYKSGDLVRYLPDGNLVFLGRNDDQVKIRGFRIELGEIEKRLDEHPDVREVLVLATSESGSDKRLVAYVVSPPHENLAHMLRVHLATTLPEYMIPSAFVRLDVFPLTNNGKIDRRALPGPDSASFDSQDYVAPQGETEIALAKLWSELLKVEEVGRHDNFFMLGGHSLLAMRFVNRVSATLGYQLPLATLFSTPTLSALAEVVSNKISQDDLSHSSISPVSRDGLLELSFAQQRLWFLAQMEGVSDIYHVPMGLRLRGTLNTPALEKAFNSLFARHESLRSVFVAVDGQPKGQLLPSDTGLPLIVQDLRDEQDRETIVKQLAAQEAVMPFDLEKGPLVRAQLLQVANDEYVFLFTQHHIITDGWSSGVLFHDLNELYAAYSTGQPNPLAPLTIQYPDYAAWQRQWFTEDRLKEQVTYWRETLAGAPVSIELPTDRPRPPQQSFVGGVVPIRLDAHLTSALNNLSQKHGVTMFMTMLAAWSAVLSRLSGQDDLVIGTPTANRNHPQVEQMIGFFVNTLALRIDLSGEPRTTQLLERIRDTTVAAQAHQDLPFEQVVEIAQPPRRMDQTPLFQVLFAWQNNDVGAVQLQYVEAVDEDIQYDIVKFDLELEMIEENDEVVGTLRYSTALFDLQTIERHAGYLEAILRWMVVDMEHSIGEAPILGLAEQELLIQTWNVTDRPYPDNTCIDQLFEDQVKSSPEAIAIVHDDQMLTYRELNSRANEIAHQLVAADVKPGDNVLILLNRSIDLVATQIAILKVGATYVPIDTKAPVDRQAYISSDCGAKLLITDENIDVPVQIKTSLLRLSADHSKQGDAKAADTLGSSVRTSNSSLDTAYIMYTSGSTGRPKGVMVSHRGIANLAIDNGFADFDSTDRVAFSSNPSFDPSTFEVWAPLLNGASIVIIDMETFLDPHRLAEALIRHQVTFLHMTNALLHQYAFIIGETLSNLKYLTGAAEQGSIKAYWAVLKHGGPVRLLNRYGPTETTVDASAYLATSAINELDRLPIGKPIHNNPLYVLDSHRNLTPLGSVGELYIGGPGVANGYLNRPDLTAERFLPDPFSNVPGARMYKTGDLVRYLPDGNIVFLGRNDDQVKIRGYRIELGEIQTRLAAHPQVREVAVFAIDENSGDKRLVAYVVSTLQENMTQTLREHLAATLPEYMIPSAFVRLDTMPLTNNGKINRLALPEPDNASLVTQDYVAPQGDVEVALAELWSELLKIERVGRHDNFFMLGGHSLLAVRMIGSVQSHLGVKLNLQTLFTSPTIAELAQKLIHGSNSQDDEYAVLLPLKTQGSRPPLFCIHPGLGLSWQYMGFAKHLHPEQRLYGLQARGLDGKTPLAASVEEMALDYLDHIRKIQPHGPYHLLGWSFGGTVAHSIAVELEKQGEKVPLLVIMDSTVDHSSPDNVELSEQDGADLLFSRLGNKDSTVDGWALWKKTSPIVLNNTKLASCFTPSVYSGDVLFFRATVPQNENSNLVDPATWARYALGKIQVRDVECTHVEMDDPENMAVIGGIVAARIEELER